MKLGRKKRGSADRRGSGALTSLRTTAPLGLDFFAHSIELLRSKKNCYTDTITRDILEARRDLLFTNGYED